MIRTPLHADDEIPIVFRYRPEGAVPFVDLRGDLVHWSHVERMEPVAGGLHEATVRLGPGTYAYKIHLGGDAWRLDPDNPRTRARDGIRNSLLVVGGAGEPVLHAPAPPWVSLTDDGWVRLAAGLRRGHGEGLRVRWDEGGGPRAADLHPVAAEDEHVIHEVLLPASARAIEYVFLLPDGRVVGREGGAGQCFRVPLAALGRTTPGWWKEAVIYSIFVDGDLDGVTEALGHLADLGVTAIHLTPVVAAGSAHLYDAVDPRRVDPAVGGEAALGRLLEGAHRRGLRVILDLVVTHVHHDFFGFRDVRERGWRSPYTTWFHVRRWPFAEGPDGGYLHRPGGQWHEPLLRTGEPEVIDYLAGTSAHWARFGADGLRVAGAADVPLGLLRRVAAAARAERPDCVVCGEVVPDNLHRFTAGVLDAGTDFPAREALLDFCGRGRRGARRAAELFGRRRAERGGPGWTAIGFTATPDPRRASSLAGDGRRTRLAILLVLLRAAVPALCHGEDAETLGLIRAALRLRRERAALRAGDEAFMGSEGEGDDVLVVRRTHRDEIVEGVLHAGEGERTVALPGGVPSGAEILLTLGEAALVASVAGATLRLGPWSAAVLGRVPAPGALAASGAIQGVWGGGSWGSGPSRTAAGDPQRSPPIVSELVGERSGVVAALAFREGLLETPALPPKLYVTVTERCNLRCLHCITDAPARTREGRARTVQPWLVAALGEAFAAAEYVGFVHGGEALVAPVFTEILRAIQRARAGRATEVHLLSNGMLLDGARARELVDLGLTSLSVSIDGATAAANDRIRLGGDLAVVLRNLGEVARVRAAPGIDLRVGVSTVVAAGNVEELPALGRLVRGLGLDWLKVEEMFPCTPLARHERILPRVPAVERAMAALREALAGSDVVLVDHRDPPPGCGCAARADPALAAFRAADDFANRTTFHPCRAEWEQACVDPDGDVRAVDYSRPPLGSLAAASFLELWNGPAARAAREAALRRTSPRLRAACPVSSAVAAGAPSC